MYRSKGVVEYLPVRYKGMEFHSTLEARWATFFTILGCRWEYRRRTFRFKGNSLYVPDFHVQAGRYSYLVDIDLEPPSVLLQRQIRTVCKATNTIFCFFHETFHNGSHKSLGCGVPLGIKWHPEFVNEPKKAHCQIFNQRHPGRLVRTIEAVKHMTYEPC